MGRRLWIQNAKVGTDSKCIQVRGSRPLGASPGRIARFAKVAVGGLIIFRPAIVYNKQSKKYVLWLNRLPRMGNSLVVKTYEYAGFVVGTSSTPYGPFTVEEDEDRCRVQMDLDGGADFAI